MSTNREEFLGRYSGKKLLEDYKLNEKGLWKVSGEDPNCDFGGHHSNPYLGTYEGRLTEVIDIAVELEGFWTWGGGGIIEKVQVHKVDSAKRYATLQIKRKELQDKIDLIDEELTKDQ